VAKNDNDDDGGDELLERVSSRDTDASPSPSMVHHRPPYSSSSPCLCSNLSRDSDEYLSMACLFVCL